MTEENQKTEETATRLILNDQTEACFWRAVYVAVAASGSRVLDACGDPVSFSDAADGALLAMRARSLVEDAEVTP
jgi:hypothetical protein